MTSRVPIRQDRTLFNPKFEGYKLSFLEESRQHFVPVGAPGPGVVVPKLPPSAKLSYREVQSRIRHNHLHPGWNSFKPANGDSSSNREGLLFVIDGDFMLISLQFDKVSQMNLASIRSSTRQEPLHRIKGCELTPSVYNHLVDASSAKQAVGADTPAGNTRQFPSRIPLC